MKPNISQKHRAELLRFLLLKTAAVRSGIKPAELLRVKHCYESRNSEGLHFCLYRQDIFRTLGLNYIELQIQDHSSLVLFYHRETLHHTLQEPENKRLLRQFGYPENASVDTWLAYLRKRFGEEKIPHEVGIFIGYPTKDVAGFIEQLPPTPVHRGDWMVFGDAVESLRKMELYRKAERTASMILDACDDLHTFFEYTADLRFLQKT